MAELTDYESYLRVAKYTLVKSTDMNIEMKEEVSASPGR
jgi:hypothetical protein